MDITHDVTDMPTFYFNKVGLFNGAELRTLFFVARHTIGKGRPSTVISIRDFIKGYPELGQHGTRLAKGTQVKSIQSLVKLGVLIEVAPDCGKGKEWALQTNENKVDIDALWTRHQKRKVGHKKRTRAATEANRYYPKIDFTPPSTGRSPGFVYVMKGVYGYKIGHSINPLKRARKIHNILLAWHPVEDREEAEKSLHEMFSNVRIRGEYFDLSEDDLSRLYKTLSGEWVKL
jgi:hypothetical protein